MQHILSEDFLFSYTHVVGNEAHIPPPEPVTESRFVHIVAEFTTANRKSPFFIEPRLVLDFGGSRSYLIEPSLLQNLELAARTTNGEFMLDIPNEWIKADEVARILQWLQTELAALRMPDEHGLIRVRDGAREVVVLAQNGTAVVVAANDTDILTPAGARRWAKTIQRAANIADYLNILATKPAEAST